MTGRALSPRDRYRVIIGDTFRLDLPAGEELRIDSTVTDPKSQVLIADADGIAVVLSVEGRYYLAWRETVGMDVTPWRPVGVIDSQSLINTTEETLRKRVADLEALIDRPEAIRTEISASDGTSLKRLPLPQLKTQLDRARSQLADYLRRRRGLPSARLRG